MIEIMVQSASSHLVQSTLFAGAAALLTLAFRANRAQVRFWLWFSASLKFLIPFALLSVLGSQISTWVPPSSFEGIKASAPAFIAADGPQVLGSALGGGGAGSSARATPWTDRTGLYQALAGVWLSGVACVALLRLRGWRRIRQLICASVSTNIAAPMETRATPGLMEPGVVGWRRPLLLLPQGIDERLSTSELNAILAHELCHIRRRDNLLALIHMTVEAIFWFHPLVWWIGARLIEERERACDEDVVSRGNAPGLYAEAIVKVCKWSTESPLTCVSGVTGGNLKRRIEQIMDTREVPGLSFAKGAALTVGGVAVLLAPVLVGIANAPATLAAQQPASEVPDWQVAAGGQMAFEVASVKPMKPGSNFRSPNFNLNAGGSFVTDDGQNPNGRLSVAWWLPVYISFAYKYPLSPERRRVMLAGVPKWVDTEHFDIEARAAGSPTKDQMRLMMQSLLADRFKLAVHFETREVPVYVLTLNKPGKWGPTLTRHADGPPCDVLGPRDSATGMSDPGSGVFPDRCEVESSVRGKNGRMVQGARNTTMAVLAEFLSRRTGRPVVDRTGITRRIDYRVEWTFESNAPPGAPGAEVETDPAPLAFPDAVREQLGLKLQSSKGPIRYLVVDRVERPSEN